VTERARISNGDLEYYENVIALFLRILREMEAIERDLDIGTRMFHYNRIGRILQAAENGRQMTIHRMAAEKQAAADM